MELAVIQSMNLSSIISQETNQNAVFWWNPCLVYPPEKRNKTKRLSSFLEMNTFPSIDANWWDSFVYFVRFFDWPRSSFPVKEPMNREETLPVPSCFKLIFIIIRTIYRQDDGSQPHHEYKTALSNLNHPSARHLQLDCLYPGTCHSMRWNQ